MAYTQIADVFVPEVFADSINSELSTNRNALIATGAIVSDSELSGTLQGGYNQRGADIKIARWKAWDVEDVVGSDVDTDVLATNDRTSYTMTAAKQFRVFSYDAMDLARLEGLGDPLGDAVAQAVNNIVTNRQKAVVQTLNGVLLDNLGDGDSDDTDGDDGGDMITSIHLATGATIVAANRLGRNSFLDARAQRGDFGESSVVAAIMHSAVFYQLQKDDSTSFERPSEQVPFTTYLGVPVVVDDGLTTEVINSQTVYRTVLLGPNSLRLASSGVSSVIYRDEEAGNGFGLERLINRRVDIIHPEGFDYTGGSNPTNAILGAAASWGRQADRKNVGISFIRSNVA